MHGFINQRDLLPQSRGSLSMDCPGAATSVGQKFSDPWDREYLQLSHRLSKHPVVMKFGRWNSRTFIESMPLGEQLYTAEDWPNLYRTWDETDIITNYTTDGEFCWVAETDAGEIVGFALGAMLEKQRNSWVYGWLDWLGFMRLGRARALASVCWTS